MAKASRTSWTAISGTFRLQVLGKCKYVMERAKIPEDKWRTKREDLADEHKMTTLTSACESLRAGLKASLASDFYYYAQCREKCGALPKSTKTIVVEDDV